MLNAPSDAPGDFVQLKHGNTHYLLKTPTKQDDSTPVNTTKELIVMLHGASVFSFIWNRFAQWFLAAGYPVFMFGMIDILRL